MDKKITKLFTGSFKKKVNIPDPENVFSSVDSFIPPIDLKDLSLIERFEFMEKIVNISKALEDSTTDTLEGILKLKGKLVSNEKWYRTFFPLDLLSKLNWRTSKKGMKEEDRDRVIVGLHPSKKKTLIFTKAYGNESGNLASGWVKEASVSLKAAFKHLDIQEQPPSGKGKNGDGRQTFKSDYWIEIIPDKFDRKRICICVDYAPTCIKKEETIQAGASPIKQQAKIIEQHIFNDEADMGLQNIDDQEALDTVRKVQKGIKILQDNQIPQTGIFQVPLFKEDNMKKDN